MHWRGDRTGATQIGGESLERAAFKEFRGAFHELLGRPEVPTVEQMNDFTDFVMQLRYPPNPNRNLDDTMTAKAQQGADIYFNEKTTGFVSFDDKIQITCNECHEVDANIERFGTNTMMSFEGVENEQDMKVPHLRNVYTRIGMFGQIFREDDNTSTGKFMGDQVTGYGLSHDGGVDTMENFLTVRVFHTETDEVDEIFEYVTQVPTGLAPMVGQQATLTAATQSQASMVDLMLGQATLHLQADGPNKQQCDLIAWGVADGVPMSWSMNSTDQLFTADDGSISNLSSLKALSREGDNTVTFMCTPPGSGQRIAIDRDEDGLLNKVDNQVSGRKAYSVAPANPRAATKYLTIDRTDSAFRREQTQRADGTFPDLASFNIINLSFFTDDVEPATYDPFVQSKPFDPGVGQLFGYQMEDPSTGSEPVFVETTPAPPMKPDDVLTGDDGQSSDTGTSGQEIIVRNAPVSKGGGSLGVYLLGLVMLLGYRRRFHKA